MASTVPFQTRNSHVKTPVVVALVDSNIAPPSQPSNVIPYIRPVLSHLSEANHPHGSIHLGVVNYGLGNSSSASSQVSMNNFALVDVHNEPTTLPESHPMPGLLSSGMPSIDGYVFAMKMIEYFKVSPKQNPEEEFSYHLLHITADQNNHSEHRRSGLLYWNRIWEDVPEELQRNNVTLLTIPLYPHPGFSGLVPAIPPETMKSWPRTRPHYESGLSGLNAHDPNSGAVPSTVLAKRPADDPVEHRSLRQKMEDTSQAITEPLSPSANPSAVPCQPPITYTAPTVPQVTASDSTIQPSSCEAQCTMGDKPVWSGNLIWLCGGSEVDVPVQATYPIRDLRTSKWPNTLRIEIIKAEMSPLDMQARIQKHKAPVTRFQCLPGIDNQHFGELVKTLREGKCVAVVQLEIEIQDKGSLKSVLVLAPLHESLLCATFPASDIPKARVQQPQQEAKLQQVDYASPTSSPSPFENVPESSPEEDLGNNQTNAFAATMTPVQSTSQQQFQLQQQPALAYGQGQLEQLQALQDVQQALMVAHITQAGALVPRGSEPQITTENGASNDFDLTHPQANQWGVSSELYYGGMDGMPQMWADAGHADYHVPTGHTQV